jgi:hypothetical protein
MVCVVLKSQVPPKWVVETQAGSASLDGIFASEKLPAPA